MISESGRKRLLEAVRDPRQRALVSEILGAAGTALASLAHLEATIFERRTETGAFHLDILVSNTDQVDRAVAFLTRLAEHLFTPSLSLAQLVESRLDRVSEPTEEPDLESFDFDIGSPERTGSLLRAIGEADLEDAFVPVISDPGGGVRDEEVAAALVPLASALIGEIHEIRKRTEQALEENNPSRALRELDGCRESFEEAIGALLDSLCGVYRVEMTRGDLIPGYRSALDDALMIRRSIADLRRVVQAANAFVQQPALPIEERAHALVRIAEALEELLERDVLVRMRATDRWEFMKFREELSGREPDEARLTAEGFAKYLDSLSAINDRRVLLEHDRSVFQSIREALEAGASIVSVSEHGAVDLYAEALGHTTKLLGYRDDLDELIRKWETSARTPSETIHLARKLEELVPPA
ncbi:MAG: hypothetical protein HY791_13635 [Deltaproteobacteria bacterium]|nr:hypothetical protein [Deltaproteobacteria bacterium]